MATPSETLLLEVATPHGLALRTEVESVAAPSVEGEFGVLPGHLPLLAALRAGVLKYRTGGTDHLAAVGTGFVEAGPTKVVLLTDQFAEGSAIDGEVARRDLIEAEEKLRKFDGDLAGPEHRKLEESVDWALARLSVRTAK